MYFRAQGEKERLVNSPTESVIGFNFLNLPPERGAWVSFRSATANKVSFGPWLQLKAAVVSTWQRHLWAVGRDSAWHQLQRKHLATHGEELTPLALIFNTPKSTCRPCQAAYCHCLTSDNPQEPCPSAGLSSNREVSSRQLTQENTNKQRNPIRETLFFLFNKCFLCASACLFSECTFIKGNRFISVFILRLLNTPYNSRQNFRLYLTHLEQPAALHQQQ